MATARWGFAAAGLAVKNQRAPFGDEIRPEVGTEQGQTQGRLQTEVELLNGLEEGEVGLAGKRCKRVCLRWATSSASRRARKSR